MFRALNLLLIFAALLSAQNTITVLPKQDRTATGELRFLDKQSTSHYVGFRAPASVAADLIWTLPTDNLTGVLTNTAGVLSWASAGACATCVTTDTVQDILGLKTFTGSSLKIGATAGVIVTPDWGGFGGSWIDLPITGPSGIGSGGVGQDAWIGYAKDAHQWFPGSVSGDIAYRNTVGRLLFGAVVVGGEYQMAIGRDGTVNISGLIDAKGGITAHNGTLVPAPVASTAQIKTGKLAIADSYDVSSFYYFDASIPAGPLGTQGMSLKDTDSVPIITFQRAFLGAISNVAVSSMSIIPTDYTKSAVTYKPTLGDTGHRWDKAWVKDLDVSGTVTGIAAPANMVTMDTPQTIVAVKTFSATTPPIFMVEAEIRGVQSTNAPFLRFHRPMEEFGQIRYGTDAAPSNTFYFREINSNTAASINVANIVANSAVFAAPVYLLDTNHSIQAVGGQGVYINTYGVTNPFFVQQGTGNIGINSSSPAAKLHIATVDGPYLAIGHSNWTGTYYATIGGLVTDGGSNTAGRLIFSTRNSVVSGGALVARMQIDEAGIVDITGKLNGSYAELSSVGRNGNWGLSVNNGWINSAEGYYLGSTAGSIPVITSVGPTSRTTVNTIDLVMTGTITGATNIVYGVTASSPIVMSGTATNPVVTCPSCQTSNTPTFSTITTVSTANIGTTLTAGTVTASGYLVSGIGIIDSGRNLYNLTAVTMNGALSGANNIVYTVVGSGAISVSGTATARTVSCSTCLADPGAGYTLTLGAGLYAASFSTTSGNIYAGGNISAASSMTVGGSQFIDSSRNLSNIGSISLSGGISTTGGGIGGTGFNPYVGGVQYYGIASQTLTVGTCTITVRGGVIVSTTC